MPTRAYVGAAIAVVAAAAIALSGCAPAAQQTEQTTTLKLGLANAPQSFDPAQMGDAGNMLQYAQAVYDSLLHKAPDGTIEPWLATDWKYNDDNTELTLTLRDDVTFANGEKFTPEVAVANLEHFKAGGGPQGSMLAELESVAVGEGNTVVLKLSAPNPSLISYLTTVAGLQVSMEGLENPDLATVPSGSGPYKYDADGSTSGSVYSFEAREDYWNEDIVDFDTVEIRVLEDPAAVANAFASGQVDAVPASVETLAQFENTSAKIDTVEGDWSGFMMFDRTGQLAEPLGDVRVRQAFNYAIDRDQVLETVVRGYGTVTTQIFSPEDPGYVPELDDAYDYDPERAKELLAEAGYPDGFDVTMIVYSASPADTLAVYAQQLAEVGIRVTWETQDLNTFLVSMTTGKTGINPMQFGAKGGWEMINQLIAPNAPWNPLHDQTDELTALIEEVRTATDDAAQAEAVQKVNTYVVENAWFSPWFRVASPYATNPEKVSVEMQYQQTIPSLYNFSPAE
ncbi:ABC transporter substrate-binding protein [Microbacterium sp. ZXX196]|uniref:ABC transporter substrate-binding protein n=1 Tax=Microbacterium sp. ZXX196 TaxID=2609291 RepID=UPI0012B81CC5|nr:ABC transporter substrate-binding protein [Microbacterium sp. ZXX196]MTE24896.1 ABC transporter substrate-binding protein [Microbacterium sp. ZXX196]